MQINPDLAKGYKSRGVARAMLGLWGDAARDLHIASKLDFDEEISAVLKKVLFCDIISYHMMFYYMNANVAKLFIVSAGASNG